MHTDINNGWQMVFIYMNALDKYVNEKPGCFIQIYDYL